MSGQIGSHQQGAFSTPTNGQPTDASVVLSNDNANRTTTNAHDADATIHIQSSVLASRPAAGTAQRVWITTDGLRAYVDSGSVWNELDYLSKTAGGTVAGAVTLSASLTAAAASFSGAVTMASTLAITSPITIGTNSPGLGGQVGYKDDGGTARWAAGIVGAAGERKWSVYDSVNTAYRLTISETTGAVTILSGGLTVSSGTTAVQALTATTVTVTGSVAGVFSAVGSAVDPTAGVLRSDNAVGNKATLRLGTSNGGFAANNAYVRASQGSGIDSWVLELGASNTGAGGVAQTILTMDVANGITAAKGVTISAGGLSVTGGITGTISTAAQPNITSVGVLAAPHLTSPVVDSGGITVTGNSVVTGTFKASAQGLFGPNSGAGTLGFLAVSSDTVGTASAGAASLPAAPVGFLAWYNGSTVIKIPYYA